MTLPHQHLTARPLAGALAAAALVVVGAAAPAAANGEAAPAPVTAPPADAGAPQPPAGQQSDAPAPSTAEEARARLAEVTAQLADAEAREGEAQTRAEQLAAEAEATRARLTELRDRLGDRARAVYTGGLSGEPLMALLTSERPTAAVDRLSMLDAAQGHDGAVLDRAVVVERRLSRQQAAAAAAAEEAGTAKADLQRAAAELDALLQRLVAEEEAARARAATLSAAGLAVDAAATGVTAANGQACPVGPVHTFIDSWGFARSGGRAHKGTDVMAPYGAPAFAVVDGVVDRVGSNGLGGIVLYLVGDNGDRYYYAHNAANLVSQGQRVTAGQEIAKVGNSGNAAGGAAHIHFEVHPGGGAAVNPYPFLKALCG